MYLVWYDDSPKKSVQDKIDEAADRFYYRFGLPADLCLVSEGAAIEHPRLEIRHAHYVRPHYYQVGRQEMQSPILGPAETLEPAEEAPPVVVVPAPVVAAIEAPVPAAPRARAHKPRAAEATDTPAPSPARGHAKAAAAPETATLPKRARKPAGATPAEAAGEAATEARPQTRRAGRGSRHRRAGAEARA